MFEALGRLPVAERPPWLLLTRSGLAGSALFQELAAGPPAFETASLGDDLLLVPAHWELLDRGERPFSPDVLSAVAGLAETDRLDVCDARDEEDHEYRVDSRMGELLLAAALEIDATGLPPGASAIADGGRLVAGSERFVVHTRAGRDLTIVLRTHATIAARTLSGRGAELTLRQTRLSVRVAGDALSVALPAPAGWSEHVLRIPAALVRSETTSIEISGRYTSFHYWFYQ